MENPGWPVNDPTMTELQCLYNATGRDWNLELAKCRTLLRLLPAELAGEHLAARDQGAALFAAIAELIKRTHDTIKQNKRQGQEVDSIGEKAVMAGAAALGFIKDGPDDRPDDEVPRRSFSPILKGKRQRNASGWYPAQGGDRWFRDRYLVQSVREFRDALRSSCEDQGFLRAVANRVGKRLTGQQPRRHTLDFLESTKYTRRSSLHDQFQRLRAERHRVIALEGEPGTGKSRAAREILREIVQQDETVAYIRNSRITTDIAGVLATAGVQIGESRSDEHVEALVKVRFAEYVCSPAAPEYVLLDDIEDRNVVEGLIPPNTRSLVVITSQRNVRPRNEGCSLTVRDMDIDEASQLVINLRSTMTPEDRELLIGLVGGRPIALQLACGLVSKSYTVAQFCADALHDAPSTFDRKLPSFEWTMTWIYRKVLDELIQSSYESERDAGTLLEQISFLGQLPLPEELLFHAFINSDDRMVDHGHRGRFRAAVMELQARYLLESRQDEDLLDVHSLTRLLIRGIAKPRCARRLQQLHRAVRHLLDALQFDSDADLYTLLHAADVLHDLSNCVDLTFLLRERLTDTCAKLMASSYRVGGYPLLSAQLSFFIDGIHKILFCTRSELIAHAEGASPEDIIAFSESACAIMEREYEQGDYSPTRGSLLQTKLRRSGSAVASEVEPRYLNAVFLDAAVDLCDDEYVNSFAEIYGGPDEALDAKLEALCGELLLNQGQFEIAVNRLVEAWEQADLLNSGIERLRRRARILRALATASSMTACRLTTSDGTDILRSMAEEVSHEIAEARGDMLADAFLHHAIAIQLSAICIHSNLPLEEYGNLANKFSDATNGAVNRYRETGYRRGLVDLWYTCILVWASREGTSVHHLDLPDDFDPWWDLPDISVDATLAVDEEETSLSQLVRWWAEEAVRYGDDLGFAKLMLCDVKLTLTSGALPEKHIVDLEAAAFNLALHFGTEYWYREALICACVARWRNGMDVQRLLVQIEPSSMSMCTVERLQLLKECLSLKASDQHARALLRRLLFRY